LIRKVERVVEGSEPAVTMFGTVAVGKATAGKVTVGNMTVAGDDWEGDAWEGAGWEGDGWVLYEHVGNQTMFGVETYKENTTIAIVGPRTLPTRYLQWLKHGIERANATWSMPTRSMPTWHRWKKERVECSRKRETANATCKHTFHCALCRRHPFQQALRTLCKQILTPKY
jgi:hypothetical protein